VDRDRLVVLPVPSIRRLENSGTLRLTEHQSFSADAVASVTLHARGESRSAQRRPTGTPPRPVWSLPESDRSDAAFAGYTEQVERLWISRYVANLDPDLLYGVARIEYHDRRGRTIGYLELCRSRGAEESTRYYMRTGRTIVPGLIDSPLGSGSSRSSNRFFEAHRRPRPDARIPAGVACARRCIGARMTQDFGNTTLAGAIHLRVLQRMGGAVEAHHGRIVVDVRFHVNRPPP
jgi:hypothetical protein